MTTRERRQHAGLAMLQRVNRRLAAQYGPSLTHNEAVSNFRARAIMVHCANLIFVDVGIPIVTVEEVIGAQIIEREIGGAA